MKFIADLHIHSKYSIATSKKMEPETLHQWAQLKGVQVLGTGDFTHPLWFSELREKLEPAEPGLFRLRRKWAEKAEVVESCKGEVRFLLTGELSSIYKKNGRTRKVHNLLLAPDFETVAGIGKELRKRGKNIDYDGRPIIGLDSKHLLEIALAANPDTLFVPAHIWTPHFSVLGAKSGFDSLAECFEELTEYIYAIETGLSSDPAMNWRLTQLDKVRLLSNSDSHSPEKIARNANLFDADLSFSGIRNALVHDDPRAFLGTLDFFPEEGKYHYDGHRKCGVRLSPGQTGKKGILCPVCGRKITLGVLNRVEGLADRPQGGKPENARPFEKLIPLKEI
ncbi:MAG: endonuclease Q family protein, partial [bacterium]